MKHLKSNISTNVKLKIKHYIKYLSKSEYRYNMKNNKKYKDIEKGKRCFVLGNGPPLNSIDITLLENKEVFTVNQINRSPIFYKLFPKNHCIVPWSSKSFFESLKFKNKIIYYSFFSDSESKQIKKVALTKRMPSVRTVVQSAIFSAIYFGYEEIYLLGIETTYFYSLLKDTKDDGEGY